MGCDIFITAQRKTELGWETVPDKLDDFRSYAVFGALAGVRSPGTYAPISHARGMPDDAPEDLKQLESDQTEPFHSAGLHHFSWLTSKEILEWKGWNTPFQYYSDEDETLGECCDFFLESIKNLEVTYGETRILFFFGS